MIRSNYGAWRDYFSPTFHPSQHDAALSQQWLRDNAAQLTAVARAS
jgi:predicted metal-dependent hydrolase